MDDAKFTSIHKKFHFHTTILPWLKFLVDGSEFLVDGSAWNLVKITTKPLLSSVFCMGGVMDDAKNKIYLERGPRAEWGPGSARAPIKSFNLEPCTRTQDPFHSEDPFQRKLCSNSLPSTRNFTSTQQSCPGLSFLWMEVNFLWMEVPGSTLFLTWWPTVAVCFLRVGGDG